MFSTVAFIIGLGGSAWLTWGWSAHEYSSGILLGECLERATTIATGKKPAFVGKPFIQDNPQCQAAFSG